MSLGLRLPWDASHVPYNQQLLTGCPLLSKILVSCQSDLSSLILRDVWHRLSTVAVKCYVNADLLPAIHCVTDKTVTLPFSMISVMYKLHGVRRLNILPDEGPSMNTLDAVGPLLRSIQTLEVYAPEHASDQSQMMCKLSTLAPHLMGCKHVTFRGWTRPHKYLSTFIKNAKFVEQYWLMNCMVNHLHEIENLDSVIFVGCVLHPYLKRYKNVLQSVGRLRAHTSKQFNIKFEKPQSMVGII